MTIQAMRGLLQARLLTLGWEAVTSYEGKGFIGAAPDALTPYQEVDFTFAEPLPISLSGSTDEERGLFQVRLLWPVSIVKASGTGAPNARAQAIRDAFPRNLILTGSGAKVHIKRKPQISRGPVQGDRDVTLVRIRFSDR